MPTRTMGISMGWPIRITRIRGVCTDLACVIEALRPSFAMLSGGSVFAKCEASGLSSPPDRSQLLGNGVYKALCKEKSMP